MTGIGDSLPPIDDLSIPANIHATTPEQKQLYSAAREFERTFVSYMVKQMNGAAKAIGGDEESDATVSSYQDMAQDQLTDALLNGGGFGIAASLYEQINGPTLGANGADGDAPSGGAA